MVRPFKAVVGRQILRGSAASSGYADNQRFARAAMNAVSRNYNALIKHIKDVTPEVLIEALEPTFEKSKVYCPEDTGRMKASAFLEITPGGTVAMGYGKGGNPEYTAEVHENLEWRHKSPTRAKWLQVALEEDEQDIQRRIVAAYGGIFQ